MWSRAYRRTKDPRLLSRRCDHEPPDPALGPSYSEGAPRQIAQVALAPTTELSRSRGGVGGRAERRRSADQMSGQSADQALGSLRLVSQLITRSVHRAWSAGRGVPRQIEQ